jgi:mono/diheme cytochrome c family protein
VSGTILVLGGAVGTLLLVHAGPPAAPSTGLRPEAQERPSQPDRPAERATSAGGRGRELYANYCAGCHGENGDGNGPAARFLDPKPRDFGEAKFRIITTTNQIPSDADLKRVVTNGMPGSAMFPFGHLDDADVTALVGEVRRLVRLGVEERLRKSAADSGDALDEKEMAELINTGTQPGDPVPVPDKLPEMTAESVRRGAELFRNTTAACAACHGEKGKGDGVQEQRNDNGMPTRPRDLTRGIFKGGRDPRQLYARIVRGLPGSPMPGNSFLKPADIGDLINHILSLSTAEDSARTQHRRQSIPAARVPALPEDAAWPDAKALPTVVTPLWWRNYEEPALRVAALHDGRSLAIRLTWNDATRNDSAVRPQDFEDLAAVQLFKGSPEPFLGMGAVDKSLDVWLWRAGWLKKPAGVADVDTAYPNMAVDLYPFERKGDGPRPHATERQDKDYLAALAVGNALADPSRPLSAASLTARGFGTLTMRPRPSQAVGATATWKDGRWTVVLRRPLNPGDGNGLALAAGDRVSVAFALWDGAARDRNGQKLVSIWHDLLIEK